MFGEQKKKDQEEDLAPYEVLQEVRIMEQQIKTNNIPNRAAEIFKDADSVLMQPFNFYSFAVLINAEQQMEIMERFYPKKIKNEVVKVISEKDVLQNEVSTMRKMTKTFKQTEEKSNKLISELKTRYEMVKEEKEQKEIEFDKRLNTLIRDFVKIYKKLGDEFGKYKDYIQVEVGVLN